MPSLGICPKPPTILLPPLASRLRPALPSFLALLESLFAPDGRRVFHGSLPRGEKELDFEPLSKGDCPVVVRVGGIERRFTVTKSD